MKDASTATGVERSGIKDVLLLGAVIVLAHGPSLFAGLISDDLMLIRRARETPWAFRDLVASFRFGSADMSDGFKPYNFADFELHFFRPLYMGLLKLENAFFGAWVSGYHITNVLLHFCVTALLYVWAADFGLSRRGRFLAALMFAVFAPNSFSVAWVSGRTEILAAILIITAILCMGRFFAQRNPLHYMISMGAYLLALCSKESAVMLPFWLALSVAILYPPEIKSVKGFGARFAAISPFFLLLIPYFMVRASVLGGFPVPPAGLFYYHQPSDPDFIPFLVSRIYHAPLALFLQLPAFFVPTLFEKCTLLLWIMPPIAAIFVFAVLRSLPSPFRYFFTLWIGMALLPTINIGFNPVYFYICSLVVPIAYVLLNERLSRSERKLAKRISPYAVKVVVGYGIAYCFISAALFVDSSHKAQAASNDIVQILRDKPSVQHVYVFDVPWSENSNLVPGVRFLDESLAGRKYDLMSPSIDPQGGTPSAIRLLDDKTIESRAQGGTYFTTGIEQAAFAEDLIPIKAGMKAEQERYAIEITEVALGEDLRQEPAFLKRIRRFLRLPPPEQMGAVTLRYTFKTSVESPDNLFLQMENGHVHEVNFTSDPTAAAQSAGE